MGKTLDWILSLLSQGDNDIEIDELHVGPDAQVNISHGKHGRVKISGNHGVHIDVANIEGGQLNISGGDMTQVNIIHTRKTKRY